MLVLGYYQCTPPSTLGISWTTSSLANTQSTLDYSSLLLAAYNLLTTYSDYNPYRKLYHWGNPETDKCSGCRNTAELCDVDHSDESSDTTCPDTGESISDIRGIAEECMDCDYRDSDGNNSYCSF